MFHGQSLRVDPLEEPGVFELCFDRVGDPINRFDNRTVGELEEATRLLAAQPGLRGVLVTSAKDVFIVGGDITEFGARFFGRPPDAVAADIATNSGVFTEFEDLPVPSVVAINGIAFGGGLEFSLATSIRVMSTAAQIGVPEVKLGLFPAYGGTVRLARVAGPAVACEWIAGGKPARADAAFADGVVDATAPPEALRTTALEWLQRAMAGSVDWQARQQRKRDAVALTKAESEAVFEAARKKAARSSLPGQPVAVMTIDMMQQAARLDRHEALALEARVFADVAATQAAKSLVQAFLDEQAVKKRIRRFAKNAPPVRNAAVLGAGTLGAAIAFASAVKGVPIRMKDVGHEALQQGVETLRKQVEVQVKAGRLSAAQGSEVLDAIVPQLDDDGLDGVDIVVEAMGEDLDAKRTVLTALEPTLAVGTLIAPSASSLRVEDIAAPLQRRDNVVGMHFFHPVQLVPLVEVVRGAQTSDAAVSRAVAYAATMGKTPIVVADCPGFLVNRLLTAYLRAFLRLVADGADFVAVDAAMEEFGWPKGPAHLADTVGIDSASHLLEVISAGYPDRMPGVVRNALRVLAEAGRLGQKTGIGFYRYEPDATGIRARNAAADTHELLAPMQSGVRRTFDAAEIVDRMMLPMVVEAARALEEGVVATPAELDLATRLGLGFPAYAGGPLQYADWLGLAEVVARCERLSSCGAACEPTPRMRAMAAERQRFHGSSSSL